MEIMEKEEMITIPKSRLIEMELEIKNLRESKDVDWQLVDKVRKSLEDIKAGRIKPLSELKVD